MTPDELSTRIGTLTDRAVANLSKSVTASQKALYSDMEALLSKLELDSEGMIMQSQANRKLLLKVDGVFNSSLNQSGYYDGLQGFTDSFATLTAANEKYFDFILDNFKVDAQYIKSLQKASIGEIETLLANDGLEAALKAPLKQILNTNINTGASLSDMLTQVRQFINGSPDAEGKLLRYSKQITRDSLFNYSSSLQESVSQKSGLEWYYYQGHINNDSREFCIVRLGKYFHKKQVEKWASLSWAGKKAGTTSSTIFIYRGGWNCLHSLIPVSESVVPTSKDARKMVKDAKEVGDELQADAQKLADKYGAKLTPVNYKSYDSIIRKSTSELKGVVFGEKGVQDAVRNTLITDGKNLKQLAKDVESSPLTQRFKTQDFSKTSGYRGYLSNVKLSNGTTGEIQVNTDEMIFAKELPKDAKFLIGESKWNEIRNKTGLDGGLGHKYYEEIRNLPKDSPLKDAIEQQSRDYYSKFYYSYPSKWP